MDIIKVARLVEEISYERYTSKYKDYVIHQAVSDRIITTEDAIKLSTEYCAPDRCEDPWDYRYTIVYWGKLFEGDVPDTYNEIGCHDMAVNWGWVRSYGETMEITVYDNEYDVTYNTITGEWM